MKSPFSFLAFILVSISAFTVESHAVDVRRTQVSVGRPMAKPVVRPVARPVIKQVVPPIVRYTSVVGRVPVSTRVVQIPSPVIRQVIVSQPTQRIVTPACVRVIPSPTTIIRVPGSPERPVVRRKVTHGRLVAIR